MGCGSVSNKSHILDEKKIALKPYPDDINGLNDKVANNFNAFLKNHGANPKPIYKERPKLNFDIKEMKTSRRQSYVVTLPHSSELQIGEVNDRNLGNDFLASISEKKSAEDSVNKIEERSFFISVPMETSDFGEIKPRKPFKFSVSFNADEDINELKDLEGEAENILSRYISK
ncbi:hypothetical protein SteCoe_29705 [Stentor coeruleus]|uniref:Uncharacterized protein n=1 Tax=Stentor coeruleus TaxID=5963 RepID=A0A1R2B5D8_9CILI|nr:hypothetical protein SteCoe_29705 [Stentor coeruleus]